MTTTQHYTESYKIREQLAAAAARAAKLAKLASAKAGEVRS